MNQREEQPVLSVVIPTIGRPIAAQTLESLAATRIADRLEVILAGPESDSDAAARIAAAAQRFRNFKHLKVSFSDGDSSRKKNAGLAESSAEIVAFLDDDVRVPADWPEKVLEAFKPVAGRPLPGMVSGPSLVPEDGPLTQRLCGHALASGAAGYVAERYRGDSPAPHPIRWSRIIGCNMAFQREVLKQTGGFNPKFWPGEEMLAAYTVQKAGHLIFFCPEAGVIHYPRATIGGFIRQIFGYGATRVRLVRAGVQIELSTFVPAAMAAGAVVLVAASFFSATALRILTAAAAVYLALVLVEALRVALRSRRLSYLLLVFVIPLMHFAYGAGEWAEIMAPGRDFSERLRQQ